MVETIVTVERGGEIPAALFGAACGLVVARLGAVGLVFTAPMLALVGLAAVMTLRERLMLTAEVVFAAACVAVVWGAR